MSPKVSVIIPVYNTDKYLKKCIESCINQTLKDIEIIIINDGSTDASLEIAENYASKYNNIKIKSIENSGLSIARNTGLELARGKYVYFLDSDDWIDADCLESCYNLAEQNILEIVTFDAKKVWEDIEDDENFERNSILDSTAIYTGKQYMKFGTVGGIVIQVWAYFIRRDYLLANNIEFLPKVIYEDNKFLIDILIYCQRMMYLPGKFYNRLFRQNSLRAIQASERKVLSLYELVLGTLETIKNARLNASDKEFWLVQYVQHRMYLIRWFFSYHHYSQIRKILYESYHKIEAIQWHCIEKCYELYKELPASLENRMVFLQFVENVLSGWGIASPRQKAILKVLDKDRDIYIKQKLSRLPLSEEGKTIGIYGGGNHTRGILREYKRLVGPITCKLLCIDTAKESYSETFEGMDIINIRDAATHDLDGVVISSFLHEEEMTPLAKIAVGSKVPVYTLYDGTKFPLDTVPEYETVVKNRILNLEETPGVKRIILVGTPYHTNTGDYFISLAEKMFLERYLPDHKVVEIPAVKFWNNQDGIWNSIAITDTICITGGGFFGSHWFEGEVLRQVLESFPTNRMIILPQSLFYENTNIGEYKAKKVQNATANHKALTICYREALSLSRGQIMFGETVKQHLLPDMALLLNGLERKGERYGIKLCLRTDVESVLSQEQRNLIAEAARSMCEQVAETSMHWHHTILPEDAERIINEKLDELGSAELVITDALHCMISCALVGTPCIALPNVTGKVGGVYEWVKELPYIRYVENVEYAEYVAEAMKEMFRNPKLKECNYDLRFEEYEKKLKDIILQE